MNEYSEEFKEAVKEKRKKGIKSTLNYLRDGTLNPRFSEIRDFDESVCPNCGSSLFMKVPKSHATRKQISTSYKCSKCGYEWSVIKPL